MIGLIPAAGAGTRLQPWTRAMPKEMLQVGEKPIIEHVLDQFKAAGITKIFIIVGYRKEAIINYLGNGGEFGFEIAYLFQEKKEGLGRAIYEAHNFIGEDFAVVLGDTLLEPKDTLKNMVKAHEENNSDATLLLHNVDDPSRFGVVETDDSGKVLNLEEKPENPKTKQAIVGMYVFKPEVFKYIEKTEPGKKGEYQITDSIKLMVEDDKTINSIKHDGTWFDIGTKESYTAANKLLHSKK